MEGGSTVSAGDPVANKSQPDPAQAAKLRLGGSRPKESGQGEYSGVYQDGLSGGMIGPIRRSAVFCGEHGEMGSSRGSTGLRLGDFLGL